MIKKIKERQKGFEAKYQLDEETAFKITARRNKLLGLWLAERLGIVESEVANYAGSVVAADLEEPGDEDVIRKVMADISESNANISEDDIRAQLSICEEEARDQIITD